MIASLPPGLLLIAGALLIPLIPGSVRRAWTVILPIIGLWGPNLSSPLRVNALS